MKKSGALYFKKGDLSALFQLLLFLNLFTLQILYMQNISCLLGNGNCVTNFIFLTDKIRGMIQVFVKLMKTKKAKKKRITMKTKRVTMKMKVLLSAGKLLY